MWARKDSNLRPIGYEPPALPLSYGPGFGIKLYHDGVMVGQPSVVAYVFNFVDQYRADTEFRPYRNLYFPRCFAIFAQVSTSEMVRLKTGASGVDSGSAQK